MESTAPATRSAARRQRPWSSVDAPDLDPTAVTLPDGFRWGVATSAHQNEGGTSNNTWSAWELTTRPDGNPTIAGGQRCGRAANQWEMFGTDLALMRWLGIDLYRFSVEWSRVEPLPGHIDQSALDHYRGWCLDLRQAGITPMVTLHHFTEPAWAAERGGFARRENIQDWVRFVRRCAAVLGDVVSLWVTINEPVAYVVQGWLRRQWPPGLNAPGTAATVLENLLLAHAAAYGAIHELDRPGLRHQVGMAHNIMPLRARRPLHPRDLATARVLDRTYNWAVPDALRTGRLRLRYPGGTLSVRHPMLRGTQDYLGINHYHRALVDARGGPQGPVDLVPPPGERNDLGWTLEPWTLGDVLRAVRRYHLPVYVTEHGTVDGTTPDVRRRRFLGASLVELAGAVADGVDVRGYLHWTLTDNFEWTHGYQAQCGLFRVDRRTFERTPTSTASFYRDIITAHRATRSPEHPGSPPRRGRSGPDPGRARRRGPPGG